MDAALDTVGFLSCECTLLGHTECLVNQHLQVFLLRAALSLFLPCTQPVFVFGIVSIQMQEFALGFVEFHEIHTVPSLQPAKVPLVDIPALQHVHCTAQLEVSKLAEETLSPTVHFADKGVMQCQPKYLNPLTRTLSVTFCKLERT